MTTETLIFLERTFLQANTELQVLYSFDLFGCRGASVQQILTRLHFVMCLFSKSTFTDDVKMR